MQCKQLEAVLEREELSSLPPDAQEHLAGCAACQDMLAGLSAIVEAAQHIPAEAAPPQRVWVSLRAQLEAEGIIHEPEVVEGPMRTAWWHGLEQLLRPRALATIGAAVFLVAGGVYLQQKRATSTAGNTTRVQPQVKEVAKAVVPPAPEENAPKPTSSGNTGAVTQTTRVNTPAQPAEPRESPKALRPSPTEDAYFGESAATMNQMEGAVPARELADNAEVDAAFRDNLRTLNAFIAECEARLKKNPRDRLTREYLNMALRQKAELLTAMMDSGRSEN